MTSDSDRPGEQTGRRVPRRRVLQAAGAIGISGTLAGCYGGGGGGSSGGGNNSSGGGGASGTVKWGFDPTQAQNNAKAIKQLFHDSGLSKDITIELVPGAADTGKRQNKYTQILKSGQSSPDMFMMDVGWTKPFIARDQLMNLSDELSNSQKKAINNDYFGSMVSTAQGENGDFYGVPLFPTFSTIQYRKDLVKKAGHNPDSESWATEPMTWKKFAEVTKKTQQQTGTKNGFIFQFDSYTGLSCCNFNEFMSSWGGAYFGGRKNLFGPVGKRPVTVDKKPVEKAVRMVRTFIDENDPVALPSYTGGISPTSVLSMQEQQTVSTLKSGNTVMARNWPYMIASLATEENFGKDYGVMPMPYAVSEQKATAQGTGGSISALGGWNMTVNPNSNNKQAVMEVIKTAMTDQFQLGLLDISGWLPPKPGLFNSKKAKNQQPIGRYMDALRVAGKNTMPRPVTVVWPQESTQIYQKVNSTAKGGTKPAAAMNDLKQSLESIEAKGT